MKKCKMEYSIIFLVLALICLLPHIPKTSGKYVEKISKKVTINAIDISDKVAKIGNTYYDTLLEAIAVANGNTEETTIILLKDTNENIVVKNGKKVILDLNGNTLGNSGNFNTIENNGTLLLKNGNIKNNAPTNGAINNYKTGTITIDNVNVSVYGTGNRQAFYNKEGTSIIKGGSVLTSISTARAAVSNISNGKMTILDATIISTGAAGVSNEAILTIGSSDEVISTTSPTIRGITYGLETTKNVSFYDGVLMGKTMAVNNASRLTPIPEGYLVVDKDKTINGEVYHTKYIAHGYVVTFNANGGVIDANDATRVVPSESAPAVIGTLPNATYNGKILEGWFTERVDGDAISSETVVTGNVTFYAHWTDVVVAKILETGEEYASLQDAINAASDGELATIVVLADTNESITVPSNKNIKLIVGDHTISNSGNSAVFSNNGSLEISGGTIVSGADTAAINQLSGILNVVGVRMDMTGSRQAIYITGGEVNIKDNSYLTSVTTGTPPTTSMERGTVQCLSDGVLNIMDATIIAYGQHAVTSEGTLTIGIKDGVGTLTPTPVLIGKIDGIRSTGTLNFYDGIVEGKENSITYDFNGTVTTGNPDDIEEGYHIEHGIDEREDGTYQTTYLALDSDGNNSVSPSMATLSLLVTDEETIVSDMNDNELLNADNLEVNTDNLVQDVVPNLIETNVDNVSNTANVDNVSNLDLENNTDLLEEKDDEINLLSTNEESNDDAVIPSPVNNELNEEDSSINIEQNDEDDKTNDLLNNQEDNNISNNENIVNKDEIIENIEDSTDKIDEDEQKEIVNSDNTNDNNSNEDTKIEETVNETIDTTLKTNEVEPTPEPVEEIISNVDEVTE